MAGCAYVPEIDYHTVTQVAYRLCTAGVQSATAVPPGCATVGHTSCTSPDQRSAAQAGGWARIHASTQLHSSYISRGAPPPVFGPDTHVCSRVHTLGSWSKKDLACHGNSGNTSSARVWRRSPPPTSTPPPLAYALLLTHARVHMACATPWRCIP